MLKNTWIASVSSVFVFQNRIVTLIYGYRAVNEERNFYYVAFVLVR